MISLVVYGNELYERALNRIVKQASEFNRFKQAFVYREKDIKIPNENFNKIFKMKRGGGYWIWKPYVIRDALSRISDNEILVYCDAGCILNKNAVKRFDEYIRMLDDKPIVRFQYSCWIEEHWTNESVFEYFGVQDKEEITKTGQFAASVILLKKCKETVDYIDRWYQVALERPELFSDLLNNVKRRPCLRDNRHDQSIISIITKEHLDIVNVLGDEIDLVPKEKLPETPIFAARSKI